MKEKNTLNKLREQERGVRRNLIMDAAERVFATKPFDKVSMSEIAEEAGMATSSITPISPIRSPSSSRLHSEMPLRSLKSSIGLYKKMSH